MSKKALIICEVFYPEDFLINEVAQDWIDKGYDFEVLTHSPSYPFGKVYKGYKNRIYQKNKFRNILVHRSGIIPGYNRNVVLKILNYLNYVFLGSIIAIFIGRRYDRIFVYQTGPLTVALPAIIIKKLYGASITIWTQDLWPETVYAYGFKRSFILSAFLNKLVKSVYKNCTIILVSCEGFIPRIKTYVGDKSYYWLPNWPPLQESLNLNHTLPGEFNFTFAGNIGKVQNLEQVLMGFKLFAEEYKSCYLNIIGDGSNLSSLKQLVIREKIPNVNFTGRRPLAEMPAYYDASDVLILSLIDVSIYEITIPAKFQAYLRARKPIFAVMNGVVRTMVEANNLGIATGPSDIEGIRNGFIRFSGMDKKFLSALSANCENLLESSFSRKVLLKKLSDIFWEEK